MLYLILAFTAGALVIMSMIVNSTLSRKIGVFQGTFINYTGALLFIGIISLFYKQDFSFSLTQLTNIPFWAYLGGSLGVMIVASSNIIIPKIPTIYTTLLIFIGQLLAGTLIDYFTEASISIWKVVGGILIVIGLFYNSYLDYLKKDSLQS